MDEENVILKSFSENELKELITDSSSHVRLARNVHHIALPPSSLGNLKAAIKSTLDAMLHRYNAKFGGFLMGYKNIKVDQKMGSLINDDSSVHLNIEADFYIFTPEVGGILHGIVNTKSPDHIGCLVHSIFNVSILRPNSESDTDWKGTSVEIGDEVTLCMKLCDFSGSLPYMQGSIISSRPRPQEDATSTDKSPTKKKKKHKDTDEKESKQVDDIIVPENVFQHGKRKREEDVDEIDGAKKKKKRKREEKDTPSENSQYSNVIKQEQDLYLNVLSDQSSNEKPTEKEHKKHKRRRLYSSENGSGELEGNSDKDNKEEEVETVPRLAESKLKKKKHGKDREKIVVKEEETKVPEEIQKNTLVGGLDFSSLLARFNTTNNEKKANKTDKMSVSVNKAENKASEPLIPDIKHLLNKVKDINDDKPVKKEKDKSDTDRKEKKKKKKDASESKQSSEKDNDYEIDGGKKKNKRKRDKKDKTAESLVVSLENSQYSNTKKQEQDSCTNVKSSQSSDEKPKEKDKKKHKLDSLKNESSESEGNASKSSKEEESEDDQGLSENKLKKKKRGKDTEKEEETKVPEGVKKDIMAGELDFSSMLARFNVNIKEKNANRANRISSSLNKAEKKDLESLLPGIIPLLNKEKDVDGKKPEKKKKEKDKSNTNKKEKKKNESKQNSETLPKETDLQRVTTNDSDDDYFPVTPHTSKVVEHKDSSKKVKGKSKKEKKEKDTSKSKQSSEIGLQNVTKSDSDDDYFPVTPHTSKVMPHEDSSDSDGGKPKEQEKKSQDVSGSDSSDKEETDKNPSKQEKKSQDVSGSDSSDKEETAKNPSKSKFQLNMMDPSSPFSLLKASTANWLDQNRISKTGEASPIKKTLFMPSGYQQSTPLESNLPATMSQFLKEFSPPYTTDSQGSGKSKKSSPRKSIKAEKGTTKSPKETKKQRSSPSKNFQLPSDPFKTNFKFFEDSEKTSKDNSLNVSGFEAPDLTKALQILASPSVNKDTPRKSVTFSPSMKSATPKSESKSPLPKSPKSAEVKKSSKDKTKTKDKSSDKKKDKHKTRKKDKHKEKGEKKHKEKGEKKHKKKDKGEKKKDKEKKTDEVQKRVEEMLKKMLNQTK